MIELISSIPAFLVIVFVVAMSILTLGLWYGVLTKFIKDEVYCYKRQRKRKAYFRRIMGKSQ